MTEDLHGARLIFCRSRARLFELQTIVDRPEFGKIFDYGTSSARNAFQAI